MPNSTLSNLQPDLINKLNDIGNQLGGITARIPTIKEQEDAKEIIVEVFPDAQRTFQYFARNVLIAYDYAQSHFHYVSGNSLLDDLKDEKSCKLEQYIRRNRGCSDE